MSFSIIEHSLTGSRPVGCLLDTVWMESLRPLLRHSLIDPHIYLETHQKRLTCIRTVAQGKFGYIDVAWYEMVGGTSREVYVKRPILPTNTLLYEACIQSVVGEQLERFGFPESVPRVLDIFQFKGSVCFSMEQVEGSMTLDTYLNRLTTAEEITRVITECLYQVVTIVWVMNRRLGVNHRDLKPSNFLIRLLPAARSYSVEVDGHQMEWQSVYHLSLIDFGFACVGSVETGRSYLSLSRVYPVSDPCPKNGRDLFLFLGLLYIDYFSRISPSLLHLIESWLEVPGSDLCNFMRRMGEASKEWMYFLTGEETVRQLNCGALRVLRDLMEMT